MHLRNIYATLVDWFWWCWCWSSCRGTFWREPLWKTSDISAVVVNHVVLLNQTKLGLPRGIQWLARGGRTWRRTWRRPNTSFCIEVSVWGREWGLAPIRFHKPTSRGPILSIPQAWVYSHGLVLGEWNTLCLQIPELPYWCSIHRKSVTWNQREKVNFLWVNSQIDVWKMKNLQEKTAFLLVLFSYMMLAGFHWTEYVWKYLVGSNQRWNCCSLFPLPWLNTLVWRV